MSLLQARKRLPRLKGIGRIQDVVDGIAVKNQTSSALSHIHFWSKIQAEIRSRWISMVTEGRMKQKKLENQLKLEAKLHEVEVLSTSKQCYVILYNLKVLSFNKPDK